ncbi:MAG TPA: Hsp20/alpha crystallin family protein, partial [Candidatus Didemnitutus sp.]|nr:Hsp20/alpha crystallin family protein [Candidatus Didemnitutus sp.]
MNRIVSYTYPYTANRSPWLGLESEVSRLFDSALADFAATSFSPRFPVDLFEDKDNAYVRAELPGVSRDAINLEIVDGYLAINATRQVGEESFTLTRSISVPDTVQADKVSAAYENGVLTVTLP